MRRFVPVALVTLLLALVPLAALAAAGPTFNDLNAGSVHNANIQAIADAGERGISCLAYNDHQVGQLVRHHHH